MPNHPGTMIVAHRENGKQRIVGIIGRKGYSAVHFAKHGINREVGVVRDVLNVFVELNLSFDVITPGFHQFDISVANELLKEGKGEELLSGIRVRMCPDELSLITGLALVAVVGLGMAKRPGTMAKVTTAMAEIGVNIRLSAQGSSENSIIFGIDEDLLDVTICAIYKAFC